MNRREQLKKLRSKSDKLWYQIYLRGSCEVCGAPAVQVHHFYFKGSFNHLRYHPDNGISLCQKCHARLHFRDPKAVETLIITSRGQEWYNKLQYDAFNPPLNFQFDLEWVQAEYEKLKTLI